MKRLEYLDNNDAIAGCVLGGREMWVSVKSVGGEGIGLSVRELG